MRKVLIICLGFASLGVLAASQPASADWVKKKVCEYRVTGAYVGDVETGPLGLSFKLCREIDVLVPDSWKGVSPSGVNKPVTPSTNLKNK